MSRRFVLRAGAVVVAGLLLAALGLIVMLQSDWFKNKVRERIVAGVEDATGGNVEVGAFDYDWRKLTATIAPFIVHGRERPGQPPFFRADRIQVGLRIVSLAKRDVDIRSLAIDKPRMWVQVDGQGRTNVPKPRLVHRGLLRQALEVRIKQLSLDHGYVDYNSRRIPLELQAGSVTAHLAYDARGPAYTGELNAASVQLNSPGVRDAAFTLASKIALQPTGVRVLEARLTSGSSEMVASGMIEDLAQPHGRLNVKADLKPHDLNGPLRLPLENGGDLKLEGALTFAATNWKFEGNTMGRGLGYRTSGIDLKNAALSGPVSITPDSLDLPHLTLDAMGGLLKGHFELAHWDRWRFDGNVQGLSVRQLAALERVGTAEINGVLEGPVQLEGRVGKAGIQNLIAGAKLNLQPLPGGTPIQGVIDFKYDQRAHQLSLADSKINLGSTYVELAGTLGQVLTVHATARNLDELWSALPALKQRLPQDVTLGLKGGAARFDGAVSGSLESPHIAGVLDVTNFEVNGNSFSHLATTFDLTESGAQARSLTLTEGANELQGSAQLGLNKWRWSDASLVSASVTALVGDIAKVLQQHHSNVPVSGALSAKAEIRGTLGAPEGTAYFQSENASVYDEHLHNLRGQVTLSANRLDVLDAHAAAASGQLDAHGSLTREGAGWSNGQIRFQVAGRKIALAQIKALRDLYAGIAGQGDLEAKGTGRLEKGEFRIDSLTSNTALRDVSFDGRAYGDAVLAANSHGELLDVRVKANLLNSPIEGHGEWKLVGDDPGHGEINVPRVTFATLHELVPNPSRKELPFGGFVEGTIMIDGPLRKPDQMKAQVSVTRLQLNASAGARPRAGAQAQDLVLRNEKPLLFQVTAKGAEIENARLEGTGTTVGATGRLSFDSKSPWDLRVKGTINLTILQIFNPDLLGSGLSVIDAAIRGSFTEPEVDGRLELRNASLYLAEFPNGLDQANGLILFDRSRATVASLSAVTGGGTVTIQPGSFVGFRGPVLVYRVQAGADRVRYRSPEGVSLTVNAALSMIGTSERSVLSGTLTVIRAGFNPTTDVGDLLAKTARPVPAPSTPNEYLRGVQFDIRVESATSLEIQTSLTRNVEAAANLRIRGTPERPVVLGNLTVNEGQIDFFGNLYHINRGDINFYNTAKVEPIIDMDLETIVRGIAVDISFSGPLNKLNFSYRSDPPLQTNDIIALLAVGRAPAASNPVASTQANSNANYLSTGSNNLLAEAITAPAQGRLQRFFGVSHIKIDPQLTDITSVPQARLSLEQQISRDVTLTYITNVTRTQEQIIRVEWDLSRQWSVIALRDENGAFGIDVQYRKRFR